MSHPYKTLQRLEAWKVLDKAVNDLVANGDLDERTARDYIVGYLLNQLKIANLITSESGTNGMHPVYSVASPPTSSNKRRTQSRPPLAGKIS